MVSLVGPCSLQAQELVEGKHRHAAELRKQITAAEAAVAQRRAAAVQEGAVTRAAEAARQAMVEVSHLPVRTQIWCPLLL